MLRKPNCSNDSSLSGKARRLATLGNSPIRTSPASSATHRTVALYSKLTLPMPNNGRLLLGRGVLTCRAMIQILWEEGHSKGRGNGSRVCYPLQIGTTAIPAGIATRCSRLKWARVQALNTWRVLVLTKTRSPSGFVTAMTPSMPASRDGERARSRPKTGSRTPRNTQGKIHVTQKWHHRARLQYTTAKQGSRPHFPFLVTAHPLSHPSNTVLAGNRQQVWRRALRNMWAAWDVSVATRRVPRTRIVAARTGRRVQGAFTERVVGKGVTSAQIKRAQGAHVVTMRAAR